MNPNDYRRVTNDYVLFDMKANEERVFISPKTNLLYLIKKDEMYQNLDALRQNYKDTPEDELMDEEFVNLVSWRVFEKEGKDYKEIGYKLDEAHVLDISLESIDRVPVLDMTERKKFIPEVRIAAKSMEKGIERILEDHSVTAWHAIAKKDGGTYAVVAGFMDGFDESEKDRYGENGERLCMKMGFLSDKSLMSEYSMDWIMPQIPGGTEIYDTEVSLKEGDDIYEIVEGLYKDFYRYNTLKLIEKAPIETLFEEQEER